MTKLEFAFGAGPGRRPLVFEPAPLTVLVGPNNSGKSTVLRKLIDVARTQERGDVLREVVIARPRDGDELGAWLRTVALERVTDAGTRELVWPKPERCPRGHIGVDSLNNAFSDPALSGSYLGCALSVELDGRVRLALDGNYAGDLQAPTNVIVKLFADDHTRAQWRTAVHRAIGLYPVIDPTNLMGGLHVDFATQPPPSDDVERGLSAASVAFHGKSVPSSQVSDGVRAFTSVMAIALAAPYRLIAMDEAEAFLHPPLAQRLGQELARVAAERRGNVFAATHSADFLVGCLDGGRPVDVVRLSRDGGIPTARLLPAADVAPLMRDPLLRSAGVLRCLFARGAVVCEGDSDRVLYQEANYRLLEKGEAAAQDALFLSAGGKQAISKIIGPLRRLGVPAAAVYDVDVLDFKGDDWSRLLEAASVPMQKRQSWAQQRRDLHRLLEARSSEWAERGVALLDGPDVVVFTDFARELAQYGIFLVPGGELESWLPSLGVKRRKEKWVAAILEAMGSDPQDTGYVVPGGDGIWSFVRDIAGWIADPARRGMPDDVV